VQPGEDAPGRSARAETEIPQVPDLVPGADHGVPALHQRLVHGLDGIERPARVADDRRVPVMRVAGQPQGHGVVPRSVAERPGIEPLCRQRPGLGALLRPTVRTGASRAGGGAAAPSSAARASPASR